MSVGNDCRKTAKTYTDAFIDGIISTGCHVMKIGMCPSPVLYFSVHHLGLDGGAMVTASHNPAEYNGFKLMIGQDSIYGKDLQKLREMIESSSLERAQEPGRVETLDVLTPYIDWITQHISLKRKIRIGVDAGNGVGGLTALPILKKLGCEVHELFCEPDGNFPNHEADPTQKKNLLDLIDLVQKNNLDLGVGYDGDADRIGVVDAHGNVIYGDQLMVIFAREILERKPGSAFISEVKCSMVMYDDIRKHGGNAIMWKTGHSLIKKKMKEENAVLAGEMSGHIFFKDGYFGYDDALYATCRLLEIMADKGQGVDELLSGLPVTYTTPEIRVDCPDEMKFTVVDKMVARFREKQEIIDIDGLRAIYPDGWGLVRASNTQPALVLRFEALTKERLSEIQGEMERELADIITSTVKTS
ncbi:MAG: phosphomannomutase [Desulfobacterales bacterium]|nr:MAG: phosphomannomutase [Desulfobacterales bacterium]